MFLRRSEIWSIEYLLVVGVLLLIPGDGAWHAHRTPVWLSLGRDLSTETLVCDALLNMAIFLPLGLLLHSAGQQRASSIRRAAAAVLLAAVFSLAMETGQYLLAWRESSLLDVLSATVGTAVGFAIAAADVRRARTGTAARAAAIPSRQNRAA